MIILIHGIRDSYAGTVGELYEPFLAAGETVVPFEWGPAHFWNVRGKTKTAAAELVALVDRVQKNNNGDGPVQIDIVAHSAGALVVFKAMKLGANFSDLFFLSPAMSRSSRFAKYKAQFQRILIYHNRLDWANLGGALLPFHPFGLLGMFGTSNSNGRVINVNMPSTVGPFNHGAKFFKEPGRSALVADVVAWIRTDFCSGGA